VEKAFLLTSHDKMHYLSKPVGILISTALLDPREVVLPNLAPADAVGSLDLSFKLPLRASTNGPVGIIIMVKC